MLGKGLQENNRKHRLSLSRSSLYIGEECVEHLIFKRISENSVEVNSKTNHRKHKNEEMSTIGMYIYSHDWQESICRKLCSMQHVVCLSGAQHGALLCSADK